MKNTSKINVTTAKENFDFTSYDAEFLLTAINELNAALEDITAKLGYTVYNQHAENISVCYNRIGRIQGRVNSIIAG